MHPSIEAFQVGAELLDIQAKETGLDDAIAELAAWIDLAKNRLSEDDLALLTRVGAMLYREGLSRRQ